jgi:hypothetical protein
MTTSHSPIIRLAHVDHAPKGDICAYAWAGAYDAIVGADDDEVPPNPPCAGNDEPWEAKNGEDDEGRAD